MKVLLLVIDGLGLGAFPDALNRNVEIFGKIIKNAKLPTLSKLGFFNINNPCSKINVFSSYGNLKSMSQGKDIITLYFELAGLYIKNKYPTYPKGLPVDLIEDLEKELGTNIIGNMVADGSRVINDLGALHYNTGLPIIYTSSKSIMFIAAHEDIMPLDKLYNITTKARNVMQGEHNIARIIASPFNGKINSFNFTDNNKSYSVKPPAPTMLDILSNKGIDVISVGKINEMFNGQGINQSIDLRSNNKNFDEIDKIMKHNKSCFIFASIEAVDLSKNDNIKEYTNCVEDIDRRIGDIINLMESDDLLILSSNHPYDTDIMEDNSYCTLPIMLYGGRIKSGIKLQDMDGLYTVAHTILDYYGLNGMKKSILKEVIK